MASKSAKARDEKYVGLLTDPIKTCRSYVPKFGKSKGVTFTDFMRIYSSDPLYHWVGLDSALMYSAHKAAGGMTSIYRQLGTGCERLVRAVIKDTLRLKESDINWGYDVKVSKKKTQRLTLDARIEPSKVAAVKARRRLTDWIRDAAAEIDLPSSGKLSGTILEIRQGYKSIDAKRQNADLNFAIHAHSENYLPVVVVLSTQISESLLLRYRNGRMLILTGDMSGNALRDTYAFMKNVVGYSLEDFFQRNAGNIR